MDINKEKCKTLKQIRKRMADVLDIDLHQRECTYEGKCSGTCPKCRQEEEQLNQAILAKTALAAGVVTMTVGLTGCSPVGRGVVEGVAPALIENTITENQLAGDVEYVPPEEIEGDTSYLPPDSEESSTEEISEDATTEEYEIEGIEIDPSAENGASY